MNRNLKTSSITEAAMITGILVIVAYISSFFSFVLFFYPTPAIFLAKRKGLRYASLSLIAAGILISMLLGLQNGITFLILYSPMSIALAYGTCKNEEPNKTILYGSAAFMISFVIFVLLMQAILGISFVQQLELMYEESINMTKDMLIGTAGNIDNESISGIAEELDNMAITMSYIINNLFPAILIVSSVAMSYVNYIVASKFAKRFSIDIRQHTGISHFSFPRNFMIAMAALLLLSYLMSVFNINVRIIQSNIFFIAYMAMFVQGFAVLKFFLIKWNLNKVLITIILILVLLGAMFGQILVLTGVLDLVLDLRKIKHNAI